ncbi:hypothetical protein BBJ28_00019521 [Nothophytophthora sp. Chile5]|nr:hypothetical protein BBJ28_00019521 [Nothophytophthora sp. Chile5]
MPSSAGSSDDATAAASSCARELDCHNSGKLLPPTKDDYTQWTVAQLRNESSNRSLGLQRKGTTTEEYIKKLEEDDITRHSVDVAVNDDDGNLPIDLYKTKHCCPRLLNVLFSDKFSVRFGLLGDKATRQQFDTGDFNKNAVLWKEGMVEFHSNTRDYNEVCADDPLFEKIRPSTIVPHCAAKFIDMWKDINCKYLKALAAVVERAFKIWALGQHTSFCLTGLRPWASCCPELCQRNSEGGARVLRGTLGLSTSVRKFVVLEVYRPKHDA